MAAQVDDLPQGSSSRPDTVSALERGVAVLRCFDEDRRKLSSTELARLTGIPRPTVSRLASTLVTLGMMKHEPDSDCFMLGPGVVSLARVFLAGLDIRAIARPHMQALSETLGASVYLAVRDGLEMVLIEACRPRSTIFATRLDVGSRAPMAASALGRAYLSAVEPAERKMLIESLRLARGGEWSAHEPGLNQAFEDAARFGYCISAGEFHRDINSIAVPLIGPTGEVMALTCGSAPYIFPEQRLHDEIGPKLLAMARSLALEIGGRTGPKV